ncbi:hypothetical protein AAD018_017270 [Aestuariibius insulae]|uniref:hypothetical protein n=1 Tax=Aestuariibius insulae TaxID=2058287 RepID=UPI00345F0EAA
MQTHSLFTDTRRSPYVLLVSYETVQLGLKFEVRLESLTVRDAVIATCPSCHKRFTIAPHTLYARYHPLTPVLTIARDMKCRRCGCSGEFGWYIVRAKGPEYPRPA